MKREAWSMFNVLAAILGANRRAVYVRSGENWPGQRSAYLRGAWRGDGLAWPVPTGQSIRRVAQLARKQAERARR